MYRILALFLLLYLSGCNRVNSSSLDRAVDPKGSAAYVRAKGEIKASKMGADLAIRSLKALQKESPGNGMDSYLLAAAYARKGEWGRVASLLKEGNAAPRCIQYLDVPNSRAVLPVYEPLRNLTKDCVAAAPSLGAEKGGQLLGEVRQMAKRVAGSEPHLLISALVGTAIRILADRGLVALYEKAGPKDRAEQMRRVMAKDEAWIEEVKSEVQQNATRAEKLYRERLGEKEYQKEIQADPPSPRWEGIYKQEVDEVERPVVQRLVKSMPD